MMVTIATHPALRPLRLLLALAGLLALAACAGAPVEEAPVEEEVIGGVPASRIVEGYGVIDDGEHVLSPIPPEYLQGVNRRAFGRYLGDAPPGTIEIDPYAKFLYFVQSDGMAWRYPIAVGREGRSLRSETVVRRMERWPGWMPTANMLRREPEIYGPYAGGVPGGPASPLGARALYLYQGGRDTFYRIHGTNDLASIGNSGSAGCIRLFNHDIIHLFERVTLGTRVIIRSYEDSVRIEGPLAGRGIELPPYYVDPDELFNGAAGQRPPVPQAMMNEDGSYPPGLFPPVPGSPAADPLLASTL
jgi:lipoprotein-anchoring transpeptidase ErfK/SrfK